MFRRKRTQTGSAGPSPQGPAPGAGPARPAPSVTALQTVYMRVLQSFVDDGPSTAAAPGSPAQSPPPGAGPMAPPPVNAPGAAFVGPLVGAEGSMGSMSLNAASRQRMEAAEARAQAAIQEALGSAVLSHLTPADVQAVHARLDAMRAAGRLTDEQHAALSEGLAVLSQSAPG